MSSDPSKYELNTILKLREDLYRSIDCISVHGLMEVLKSPKHYLVSKRSRIPSDNMNFGTWAHMAILEYDRFQTQCVKLPRIDLRTKEGRNLRLILNETTPGKTLIPEDKFDTILSMRETLLKTHWDDRGDFFGSDKEVCVVSSHQDFGVYVKGRMDGYSRASHTVYDYKTTQDASYADFKQAAARYNYHMQAAFYSYLIACSQNSGASKPGEFPDYKLIVQESVEPYDFAIFQFNDEAMQKGWDKCIRALETWQKQQGKSESEFDGYLKTAQSLELPIWALS